MSYIDDFLDDVVRRSHDPAVVAMEFREFVAWAEGLPFLPSVCDFWDWLYDHGYEVDEECQALACEEWAAYEDDHVVEFEDAARGIRLSRVLFGYGLAVDGDGFAVGLDLPVRTRMWERPGRGRAGIRH